MIESPVILDRGAANQIAPGETNLIQGGARRAINGRLTMPYHFYTEPGCAACVDAKKFLTSRGIPFEERNIRANPDYLRILNEDLDSLTTPTLVLADKIIVGYDRSEYELLAGGAGTKRKREIIRCTVRPHKLSASYKSTRRP